MSKKNISYVCEGAKLRCRFGDQESTLKVPMRFTQIDGKGQAVLSDSVANKNIFPFGRCKPRKCPCAPVPDPKGWRLYEESVLISVGFSSKYALLESSMISCKHGGTILIVDSGCKDYTKGAQGALSNLKKEEKEKKTTAAAIKKADKQRDKNKADDKKIDKAKSEAGKKETESGVTNEDDIRKKIVEAAKSLDGSKYLSGAEEKGKCDCSGSVFYSYNQAGVKLTRTTAAGYHNMMTKIEKSQLKPGDVITYYSKNRGCVNHIQIYLGTATTSGGKSKTLVKDAILNASPINNLYICSLESYLTYLDKNDTITVYYGKLIQ